MSRHSPANRGITSFDPCRSSDDGTPDPESGHSGAWMTATASLCGSACRAMRHQDCELAPKWRRFSYYDWRLLRLPRRSRLNPYYQPVPAKPRWHGWASAAGISASMICGGLALWPHAEWLDVAARSGPAAPAAVTVQHDNPRHAETTPIECGPRQCQRRGLNMDEQKHGGRSDGHRRIVSHLEAGLQQRDCRWCRRRFGASVRLPQDVGTVTQ
jgi:hypothetical protein